MSVCGNFHRSRVTPSARLAQLGNDGFALSPPAFGKLLADETEKWGRVVKFAGLKPE